MKYGKYLIVKACEAILVITALLLVYSFKVNAQIEPSIIFSNGMVLQRNVEIPVWGTAKANEGITIVLNGNTSASTVESNGRWRVILSPMEAGGPFEMTIESAGAKKKLIDVYIGDVWLASGQSNMELEVKNALGATAQIAAANSQLIREFKVPKNTADEPSDIIPSGSSWKPATSGNVGNFSAAAYYFAKNLQPVINVPIGIINNSYGGSRIEAWMSDEMLGFDEQDIILAGGTYRERQPTVLFNKMLLPLINFPIKGFLWYQGESNADNMEDALEYGSLFKTMITGWRDLWGMGDLPFLWVQLPNQGDISTQPGGWDTWPQLRACQTRALSLPQTGEAVTIDVGEVDIHPKNKIPVGERLSLIARKVAYHEEIVFQGPRYKSHRLLEGGKVSVHFDHIGSGIVAKNSNVGELTGFAIASSNGNMVWANATIEGDSVVVWNNAIPSPTIVSFAWQYNPQDLNFYNVENIPAAPFKINVVDPGFVIKTFNASTKNIERGKFSVLSWEVYGASSVTLNGNTVDSISGMRVVPLENSTYTLRTVNRRNPAETDSSTISIEVVDPKPTISIRTDVGGIAEPETEIEIIADVTPPKGGSIVKVEFLVDGALINTLTEAPYKIKWTTPAKTGEYYITGIVTDNLGYSVTSGQSMLYVSKLTMLVYEAEDANYTGTGSIVKSSTKASGNKYLDVQSGWVITFDNVEVPEAGEYPLTIRYLMNYDLNKNQVLIINGENLGEVAFSAPDFTTFQSYMRNVNLKAGKNTIEIKESWGWMSFDYIAIAVEDTSSTQKKK